MTPCTRPTPSRSSTARTTLQNAMTDAAEADRAVVRERLAAGQTTEEAEAEFLTDEYFDQWYESTKPRWKPTPADHLPPPTLFERSTGP